MKEKNEFQKKKQKEIFLDYNEVGKSKILKTIRASPFLKILPILAQFSISIPLKTSENRLTFSGGIKMEHGAKSG